jgi:predicted nucleic acid-binding protein
LTSKSFAIRLLLVSWHAETLQKRSEILSMLKALPEAQLLDHEEVMNFLEARRLYGRGIGWVDAHLLASTLLTGCTLWTLDKPLHRAAAALKLLQ